jgi:aspartate aminotransferase
MINERMRELGANRSVIRELFEYGKKRKAEIGEENVYDFSLGNPSVPAPEAVSEEIVRLVRECDPTQLHGYTSAQGDKDVRDAIAAYINRTEDECVTGDCLYMTVGAAGALTAVITAIVRCGEEVIIPAPYFPEYKVFVERCGGVVKTAECDAVTMELDIAAIEAEMCERCAAVIVNSPNNPTGKVYSEESIKALCRLLEEKEREYAHPIYLIADEPYRELVYGGVKVPYLTKYYNNTIVCYSFSKSLSLPGERIGYVLVSPRCEDFTSVYEAVCGAGRALGFVCAPSLLQRLIPSSLGITADIGVYEKNRKLLTEALGTLGYEFISPDGAFYLFLRSPSGDGVEFCERAKEHEILMVPSEELGSRGYARLAYCVSTDVIERALGAFEKLARSYENGIDQ